MSGKRKQQQQPKSYSLKSTTGTPTCSLKTEFWEREHK